MNPRCPVCGELLQLDRVGRVILDYVPTPPLSMRDYFVSNGSRARVWECFGCGEFWAPAESPRLRG